MSRHLLRRFSRNDGGAAAIEFALVAIPFLFMLIGTIEFARLAWTKYAIQSAATAGARCVGVLQKECAGSGVFNSGATKSYVKDRLSQLAILVPDDGIQVRSSTTCNGLEGFAVVSVSYSFSTAVPVLLEPFMGLDLTATACFAKQG